MEMALNWLKLLSRKRLMSEEIVKVCKVHGPLTRDLLYPRNQCKSCVKTRSTNVYLKHKDCPYFKSKRKEYLKQYNVNYSERKADKQRERRRSSRQEYNKISKIFQSKSRELCLNSYMRQLIRNQTGVKNSSITKEMIDRKRQDIIYMRNNPEDFSYKKSSLSYWNKFKISHLVDKRRLKARLTSRNTNRKHCELLTDNYILKNIVDSSSLRRKDIPKQLINAKRQYIINRRMIKPNWRRRIDE